MNLLVVLAFLTSAILLSILSYKDRVIGNTKRAFSLIICFCLVSIKSLGCDPVSWILLLTYSIAVIVFLIANGNSQLEKDEQTHLIFTYPPIALAVLSDNLLLILICYLVCEIVVPKDARIFPFKLNISRTTLLKIVLSSLFILLNYKNGLDLRYIEKFEIFSFLLLMGLGFVQYGLFPFHVGLLRNFDREDSSFGRIVFLLNPILASTVIRFVGIGDQIPVFVKAILFLIAICGAFYQSLASFSELRSDRYLQYIVNSILLYWIGTFPYLDQEMVSGWALYFLGIGLAISGACICLSGYKKRYGAEVLQIGGIHMLVPALSWSLLVFFFMLSNVPLSLCFLGEDIILFELVKNSPILGIISISLTGLTAISMFRFYTQNFWGESHIEVPQLPMVLREKVAIFITILSLGLASMWIR